MRLLQLVLYFIIGYLLWRMVQVVIRMVGGHSSQSSERPVKEGQTRSKTAKPRQMDKIKDAEFEDLTPRGDAPKDPPR